AVGPLIAPRSMRQFGRRDVMTDAVRFHVELPGVRDRWSALARPILVIPHAILVGGPFVGFGGGAYRTGALGLLAITSAIFDWFALPLAPRPIRGAVEGES